MWTYYKGAKRDAGIDEGATTVAFVPEKGWFWYIPQHNDMVSVGVVAEGKYLSRDGVKAPEEIFKREIEQNAWIESYLAPGKQIGPHYHHERVFVSCAPLRLRRVVAGGRCVLLSRSRFFVGRDAGVKERRAGRGRRA